MFTETLTQSEKELIELERQKQVIAAKEKEIKLLKEREEEEKRHTKRIQDFKIEEQNKVNQLEEYFEGLNKKYPGKYKFETKDESKEFKLMDSEYIQTTDRDKPGYFDRKLIRVEDVDYKSAKILRIGTNIDICIEYRNRSWGMRLPGCVSQRYTTYSQIATVHRLIQAYIDKNTREKESQDYHKQLIKDALAKAKEIWPQATAINHEVTQTTNHNWSYNRSSPRYYTSHKIRVSFPNFDLVYSSIQRNDKNEVYFRELDSFDIQYKSLKATDVVKALLTIK